MNNDVGLWEILVPTVHTNGRPIHTRYHRVWDAKVREISGGLTIMPVAKGQWVSPEGQLDAERMIPVRVIATREQIDSIVAYTLIYYKQRAVLAYKVSSEVVLKYSEKRAPDILGMVEEATRGVPPEAFAKLPKDGATNLDHYLYGAPKKS